MFDIAIMSHKELPEDQRNDLNLIKFLCEMSACCMAQEQPEKAKKSAIEAVHHLGKLKIDRGTPFVRTLQVLLAIAQRNVLLDEPTQHAIASADLQELLKEASKIKDRQILVAISKEDTISTKEGGQKKEVEINLLTILDKANLIKDKDYTLNLIESNNRKDKCIQPLD